MADISSIRIGHLKIIDHMILGLSSLSTEEHPDQFPSAVFETCAMNSWDQVSDSLVSGETDGAFLPAPLAMNLFSQGLDIRIVMFAHRAGSMILTSGAGGTDPITRFKNRSILIPSELSVQTMLLHRLLSSAGLSFGPHDIPGTDVTGETVPPPLMEEMVTLDSDLNIGGFSVAEPFASLAVKNGTARKLCLTASLWKDHPCCVFALSRPVLENRPADTAALISLFIETAGRLHSGPTEADMDNAGKFLGQDTGLIRKILETSEISFDPRHLAPDIRMLSIIQNYMADTMGVMEAKTDIAALADPSLFLNRLKETIREN